MYGVSRFIAGFVTFTGTDSDYEFTEKMLTVITEKDILIKASEFKKKARLVVTLTTMLLRVLTMQMLSEVWCLERSTN